MWQKWQRLHVSYLNEVGCRDGTMPKTVWRGQGQIAADTIMLNPIPTSLKKRKKKKMEKIAVFPFSVYNSSDAICECYWVHSDSYTMVRHLKRLKSSRLGRVQAFPMYGSLGMSVPSLHRESTESLRKVLHELKSRKA